MSEYPPYPKATDEDIEAFQNEIGYALPEDYVRYLKEMNGYPDSVSYQTRYMVIPYSVGFWYGLYKTDNAELEKTNLLKKFSWTGIDGAPPYLISIAHSCISTTLMSLHPNYYGSIYLGFFEDAEYESFDGVRMLYPQRTDIEVIDNMGYRYIADSFSEIFNSEPIIDNE